MSVSDSKLSQATLIGAMLADECKAADWDGYGAEPLARNALELALKIVGSLPDDVPMPDPDLWHRIRVGFLLDPLWLVFFLHRPASP